jgi:hypothetical protein
VEVARDKRERRREEEKTEENRGFGRGERGAPTPFLSVAVLGFGMGDFGKYKNAQ